MECHKKNSACSGNMSLFTICVCYKAYMLRCFKTFCKLTQDTRHGSLKSYWSLQLWMTIKTHQVNFFVIFLVWNFSRLVMNDLDTSPIYRAETAFDRCGLVHWSYSNPNSLFSDIHMVVLVSQSWKKKACEFFVDILWKIN